MTSYDESPSGRVRASVPGPSSSAGRAQVGSARVSGRASVGADPSGVYGGRAAVGSGPDRDEPVGGKPKPKSKPKKAKRSQRANILTAAAAVVVILAGLGLVAGTWFFDTVQLTEPKPEDQVTQVFAADGTQLATLGDENRQLVPHDKINPVIGQAVIAAEDMNFLGHHGIDMKGILRAAWNNFTDGDTQGASTITQQYARHAAELKEISYNRKLREAVLARRIEDKYSKEWILGAYLNTTYFGRGANGIEAAVKAYFGAGRSSLTMPGQPGAITPAEAAVLASVIKQPEPDPDTGHKGFDPQNNPTAAKERWDYTVGNMIKKGWLSAPPAAYPKVSRFDPNGCVTSCGKNKAAFKIVKYVKQELRAMGISDADQAKGGLRVTTTINPKVQREAERAASQASGDSPMHELDKSYKDALVAVDPQNGRVLGYYGGADGTGWDFAGPNFDDAGDFMGGGRPPGSSFKIYTLLAGLAEGYGFDTVWDSTKANIRGDQINNANRDQLGCDPKACPLDKATVESYNFPFYWLTDVLGSKKVLETAKMAGVQYIENPKEIGARIDLTKDLPADANEMFGNELGFGQYAITALDHANGMATIANDGKYNKAHFVLKVQRRDNETGKFKDIHDEQLNPQQVFKPEVAADLDHVLKQIPGHGGHPGDLDGGRVSIAKSGTWEFGDGKSGQNGDCWFVGATRNLAVSVWVGREKVKGDQRVPQAVFEANGDSMFGSGTPGRIWKQFLDAASKAMAYVDGPLPADVNVGEPDKKGNGVVAAVAPVAPAAPKPQPQPQTTRATGSAGQPGRDEESGKPDTPAPTEPTKTPTASPTTTDPGGDDPDPNNPDVP